MKYENFEQVKELVRKIDSDTSLLKTIENADVALVSQNGYPLLTVDMGCPNERYKELGDYVLNRIKSDIVNRIDTAKAELEKL